jgi:hypothetical protein
MPRILVLLALVTGALHAAVSPAPKPGKNPAKGPIKEAATPGNTEANDARTAFARQAGSVSRPNGERPLIVGSYVWSGRADENYRPFFQWHLRAEAGSKSLSDLRCRIATLNFDKTVYHQGEWKDCGNLSVRGTADIVYRLNCPAFPAYQMELKWNGGSDVFIACNKESVPLSRAETANGSYLFSLNQMTDSAKPHVMTVTWMLWNIGGQPAKDVVQTVTFLDDKGKAVLTRKTVSITVAPDGTTEQRLELKPAPKFASIAVATEQKESAAAVAVDRGRFTGAADVEIADITTEKKTLRAKVRNGTSQDLANALITLTLLDKDGATAADVEVPIAALKAGAEQAIEQPYDGAQDWAGFALAWRSANQSPGAPLFPAIDAEGLVFSRMQPTRSDDGVIVAGTLTNHRGRALSGAATFTFTGLDDTGAPATAESVTCDLADLADGASQEVSFPISGMRTISTVVMQVKEKRTE